MAGEPVIVWMASLRAGTELKPVAFHYLRDDERYTVCGRPSFAHGHRLTEEEAQTLYKATRCRTCAGETAEVWRVAH